MRHPGYKSFDGEWLCLRDHESNDDPADLH